MRKPVPIRLSDDELMLLGSAAAVLNVSRSRFVRETAIAEAERVVLSGADSTLVNKGGQDARFPETVEA